MQNRISGKYGVYASLCAIGELDGLSPKPFESWPQPVGSVQTVADQTPVFIQNLSRRVCRPQTFRGNIRGLVADLNYRVHILVPGAAIFVAHNRIQSRLVKMDSCV